MRYLTTASSLKLGALREANRRRIPWFRDKKGRRCHKDDGSDWSLSQWSNAVLGELGEAANLIKKIERGDFSLEEAREELGKEFADVLTYLDILAFRAGVDLSRATVAKFNEVSERVEAPIRLMNADWCFAPGWVRTCRRCGCTDDRACVTEGEACHWVDADLCSACGDAAQ